jgi:hypothetical protein
MNARANCAAWQSWTLSVSRFGRKINEISLGPSFSLHAIEMLRSRIAELERTYADANRTMFRFDLFYVHLSCAHTLLYCSNFETDKRERERCMEEMIRHLKMALAALSNVTFDFDPYSDYVPDAMFEDRSFLHQAQQLYLVAYLYGMYRRWRKAQHASNWFRFAVRLNDCEFGGGAAMLKLRCVCYFRGADGSPCSDQNTSS